MSFEKIKIGVAQIPNSTEIEKNFDSIMSLLSKFESSGVDLIIFPECSLSGFSSKMRESTMSVLGPYLIQIKEWSQKNKIEVVLPTAVVDDGKIYNSGFWFDTNEMTQFFKLGLTESEKGFFSVPLQNSPKIFKSKDFNFGLLICLEAQLDTWKYFNKGEADAILWPGYWGWIECDVWGPHVKPNEENLVFKNVREWQIPLIQSNFSRNDLGDYKAAGPEGLSHVINSDNSLKFKGPHMKAAGFFVELAKLSDGKVSILHCEELA